tara:strand:+ start:4381 stop:5208 length:828 start_codon:yes stop_codon:yes gene_type:complete
MFFKIFNEIKYKFIRYIESNYKINLLIYNNIHLFKFLLPHEKDYFGMLLLCKNNTNNVILDIGASLGISSLGFRRLGFKNKIYAFEPNFFLFKNFLKKNLKNYDNINLKNIALGNKNNSKIMYMPFYNSSCIHYFCSFDKKYLLNSVKITFPSIIKNLKIKKKKISCRKFDDLKLNIKPHFIKIDTEGYDQYVLLGMRKTIKKYNPIFLIEYNVEYFNNVKNILKEYSPYIYDLKKNKMIKLPVKISQKRISRTNKENFLSIRNIYFIPKTTKIN